MGAVVDYSNLDKRISPKKNKLNWSDNNTNDTTMLVDNENHCAKNPVSDGFAICKSCVKGCGNENRYPLLGT